MGILRTHPLRSGLLLVCGAGAVLAMTPAGVARADTISYFLDQSNQVSVLPDGTDYLKVTLTSTGTAVDFTVDILSNLTKYANATGFGLDSFGFDTKAGTAAANVTASNITALPSHWSVSTAINQNGFGNFTLVPQANGSPNRISPELTFAITPVAASKGATTIDQNLADYVVLSAGHAGDGNQFFAAHVGGFTIQGSTVSSGYFGGVTPVPLPAASWLLVSGLGCLVRLRKRRPADPA